MSFLYEYMSADELELAQENARIENELLHINNEFEVLAMEHAVKLNDIELQAILENATDEDLTHMYESEMIVYQEGVAEWWEKFKAWVKGIIDAILGKANKTTENISDKDKEKELEANVNPNALQKILNTTKSVLSNIGKVKDENGKIQIGKIIAETGLAIGAAGGIAALFKPVREKYKTTISKWIDWIRTLSQGSKEVGEALDRLSSDESDENKSTIKSLVSSVQNAVSSALDTIRNAISSLTGGKDSSEDMKEENPDKNGQKDETPKDDKNGNGNSGDYVKKVGKVEWHVDKKTGIITRIENGKEKKVPKEQAPTAIRQVSDTYAGIQQDRAAQKKNQEQNTQTASNSEEKVEKPQKTEREKRIDEANKAAENGVTLKRKGKVEWRIDKSNGNIIKVEDGKETDVPRGEAPGDIRRLSQKYAASANVEKEKESTGKAPSPVTDPNTKSTFTIKPDGRIVCKMSDGSSKFIDIDDLAVYMKAKNMRKQFKKTYNEYISSIKNESSYDLDLDTINETFMESPFYMTLTDEGITLYEFEIEGFEDEVEDSLFTEMDLDDIVTNYMYVDESVGTKSDYDELMSLLDEF